MSSSPPNTVGVLDLAPPPRSKHPASKGMRTDDTGFGDILRQGGPLSRSHYAGELSADEAETTQRTAFIGRDRFAEMLSAATSAGAPAGDAEDGPADAARSGVTQDMPERQVAPLRVPERSGHETALTQPADPDRAAQPPDAEAGSRSTEPAKRPSTAHDGVTAGDRGKAVGKHREAADEEPSAPAAIAATLTPVPAAPADRRAAAPDTGTEAERTSHAVAGEKQAEAGGPVAAAAGAVAAAPPAVARDRQGPSAAARRAGAAEPAAAPVARTAGEPVAAGTSQPDQAPARPQSAAPGAEVLPDAGKERRDDRQASADRQGPSAATLATQVTVVERPTPALAAAPALSTTALSLVADLAPVLSAVPVQPADAAPAASAGGKPLDTLRIQLNPADLGTVTAKLGIEDGQLTVEITVENEAALQQLSTDRETIERSLRGIGLDVAELRISQAQPASGGQANAGAGQRDGQAQNQFAQQQGSAAGGGRGQEGQRHGFEQAMRGEAQANSRANAGGSGVRGGLFI